MFLRRGRLSASCSQTLHSASGAILPRPVAQELLDSCPAQLMCGKHCSFCVCKEHPQHALLTPCAWCLTAFCFRTCSRPCHSDISTGQPAAALPLCMHSCTGL